VDTLTQIFFTGDNEDISSSNNNDDGDTHSLTITTAKSDNENTLDRCYQCIICGPMFFQSKKKNLEKRLWRLRVTTTTNSARQQQQHHQQQLRQESPYLQHTTSQYYHHHQEMDHQQENNYHRNCGLARDEGSSLLSTTTAVLRNCCTNSNSSSTNDLSVDQPTHVLFRSLMRQLKKESQLETLYQAIECGGLAAAAGDKALPTSSSAAAAAASSSHQYQPTDCVLVPRTLINGEEPQVIACRIWRWGDLYDSSEIKRIPTCPNEKDPIYVCCNPAHWSRLYQTGKRFCWHSPVERFFAQLTVVAAAAYKTSRKKEGNFS